MKRAGLFGGDSKQSGFSRGLEKKGRSFGRCCRVDFLKDEERLGIVANGLVEGLLTKPDCAGSSRGTTSARSPSLLSNMLKSDPKLAA
jgi:hypothetical protein